MSSETLGERWSVRAEVAGLTLHLPKEVDTVETDDGTGRVTLSDEYGDAFGVLEGSSTHLTFAFGRAVDRLYGVEWGEASDPEVPLDSSRVAFVAFGEAYLGCWAERGGIVLFAVTRPERQSQGQAFIEGATVLG